MDENTPPRTRRLGWQHYWIIGLVSGLVILVGTAGYVGYRKDQDDRQARAERVVHGLRSAGPLYVVHEPADAVAIVQDVDVDPPDADVPTSGTVRSALAGVQSTWPGGTPEVCRPGVGHDRDYSGDVTDAGNATMYTSCVRLADDAVLVLRSNRPASGAATYPVFYVELLARFGTTSTSTSIDPDDVTLTRAQVVAEARRLLLRLHPLDLRRYSDAELLRAARDEIDSDEMF
ncbi:MAG: hypothetical protein JWQ74_567 [Marmoricola sp.]|nr:hypothetical protein [Marmoricola sp.]